MRQKAQPLALLHLLHLASAYLDTEYQRKDPPTRHTHCTRVDSSTRAKTVRFSAAKLNAGNGNFTDVVTQ